MSHDPDLSRGLLGHWTDVSPGGIVRDRSLEGNHGNYGIDARWVRFTNLRAIRHVGERVDTAVADGGFGEAIASEEPESWTLLHGEHLFGRGFEGTVSDLRLYGRALSSAELEALAG